MLANLPSMLSELQWDKSVHDYLRWYEVACT